ncbi:MAG TPA: hypothetical protein PK826_15210 [Anaerolineae bacterium]|nr:hypothetical protein [Ardenticatenia bacterium]MBK8539514.1 hypothetical protein [Ardenticatenia bacterium]HQZ72668.1 hypothetical protein [Anaerolineae bacterium]HRA21583.1 hypothetical protein [Anaerolineae bacterium]
MGESNTDTSVPSEHGRYTIRVKGHLDRRWAEWFEGLTFTHEPAGTTLLEGPLADQAALHGVLTKLRDLGLPIVSIQTLDSEA